MSHPNPIQHDSILAARMYYALRRAGHASDIAKDLAAVFSGAGLSLRWLQFELGALE